MKRETGKEKADDDDDEEIQGWIEEEEFCEGFGLGSGLGKRKDIEEDGGEEDKGKRRRVDETTSSTNITTSASTSTSVSNDNNTPASPSFSPASQS
ncbi:hypothetical protein VKT23_011879 [Stygiomarasmius scandens]|uniref:Uncharacterized protein n=1 Tax=Marasmiellus scandens TaxID=2682957 RepID=A0ABR1JBU3_9AGAR